MSFAFPFFILLMPSYFIDVMEHFLSFLHNLLLVLFRKYCEISFIFVSQFYFTIILLHVAKYTNFPPYFALLFNSVSYNQSQIYYYLYPPIISFVKLLDFLQFTIISVFFNDNDYLNVVCEAINIYHI